MHGSIEMQMSLLLIVAMAGYLLAARLHQPAVVGEILAGLVIGPSLLGWITYTDFVANLAHLGALILLFVVGLEFKLKEIAGWRYAVIALFGVLLPWLGGWALALAFGFSGHQAIIIGVALTATSIAITADTLREMGKLQTKTAKAIIAAAVIDDVLALMALSVAKQMAAGELAFGPITLMIVKAALFLSAGAWLGQKVVSPLTAKLDETALARNYPELVFIFAMLVAFTYAFVAEAMGLSAIVGAFVAGVSLEGVNLRYSRSFREGADYLRAIFGAIFFISLGILADLRALDWHAVFFVAALTVVALLTKAVGCGLPARWLGMPPRDALAVGIGMSPRGEVAMIIALLALNEKVIEQPAYVALVMMSLLTTLAVPLILRNWIYAEKSRHVGKTQP